MVIETARFGTLDIEDSHILQAPEGLPGFEALRRYTLITEEESYPVLWLQAVDDPDIALPAVEIFKILPDYAIEVKDEEVAWLLSGQDEPLLVLCVLVIPEEVQRMTANLAAPVLVNTQKGVMKQVIRDESDVPIRYPIFADIAKVLEGGRANAGADAQD